MSIMMKPGHICKANYNVCEVRNPHWARVGTTTQAYHYERRPVPNSGAYIYWTMTMILNKCGSYWASNNRFIKRRMMNEWIIYIIIIKIIELQIIPSSTLDSWLPWIYNSPLRNKLYTVTAKTFNHNVLNWAPWQHGSFNNKFGRTDSKSKFVKAVTTWLLRISRVNSFISVNMTMSAVRISEIL